MKKTFRTTAFALILGALAIASCTTGEPKAATVAARCTDKAVSVAMVHITANQVKAMRLAICEGVLDECAKCGVLDSKGVARYKQLRKQQSLAQYVELINECESEDAFYDTVGETDTYQDYVDNVLSEYAY